MAVRPNFINKQYNTPINVYSSSNVEETLSKQTQKLYNGAVGIDFHNLAKPGNLANSAVLRMLEEEESARSGRKIGVKRVAWPPPPPEQYDNVPESNYYQDSEVPNQVGTPPVSHPAQQQYKAAGVTPPAVASPPPAVASPPPAVRSPPPARKPPSPARSQTFSPVDFGPPRTTVTLLSRAPVRQRPSPVIASQPATTSIQGGSRMRGDQKWPPENVRQQSEAENEARLALAKGPACRPRKVKKDYSSFFAQNALNPTYPGYRAPPGTQHYIEEGTSNL